MSVEDDRGPTQVQSVFDRLTHYEKQWLNSIIGECQGYELARVTALVRVADLHALHQAGIYPIPDATVSCSDRIGKGAAILLPQLLARIDPSTKIKNSDTTPKLARWAREMLEQAGALAVARRTAYAEDFGLSVCRILANGVIRIGPSAVDLEAQENRDRNCVNDWDRLQEAYLWNSAEAYRQEQCRQHVSSSSVPLRGELEIFSMDHPYLCAVCTQLKLNAREYVESEVFPDFVQLGPLTFGQWKDVAVGIAAHLHIGISHAFGKAMLARFDQSDLINLLPRWLDDESARRLVMMCSSAVSLSAVTQVLEVFSSDSGDVERFKGWYMPPSPMLLKVPGGFLVAYHGSIANPYWYMTEKLKLLFESRWKVAASIPGLREGEFQKQLYAALPAPQYEVGKNLKLKRGSGEDGTDIDATLYERATNVVYLVQLKWPDTSSGEWNRRRNDFTRLRDRGLRWIEEVTTWLEQHRTLAQDDVLFMLELDGVVASPKSTRFELLVVSRSWTRIAGQEPFDSRAAWTSWSRLRKLIIQHRESKSPLADAWAELRSPQPPRPRRTRTSLVPLPNLTLEFEVPY
jgi:hypothetical protein